MTDLMPLSVDKKFSKPMSLGHWIVVIFMQQNRFSPDDAKRTITGLVQGCEAVGELLPSLSGIPLGPE